MKPRRRCRRAMPTWATLLFAVCIAFPAHAQSVRVIAVQPKVDMAYCETYAQFRQHVMDLVTSQVAPRLARGRQNLIAFPEDLGLPAAFIGSRGAISRAQLTTVDAYSALFLGATPPYGLSLFYYQMAMPYLPPERLPGLALTDTLWRAFHDAMRDVALETGAWVMASTNISGSVEISADPLEVFLLADPDLPPGPVYVARDPAVYNTAFLFNPSGEIVAAFHKPYITETEEGLLRFSYGALREVRPIDLGLARIGVATSKDAWMPDVLDRLAILGADTLVQPEAFGGWTIPDDPAHLEDWLPDNFRQSGWQAVQRYGELRAGVIPHLTGNLFDSPFDGQSAIITDAVPGVSGPSYVGLDPVGGFVALAPWVMADPGISDPQLTMEQRRTALRNAGFSLLPGGPNENAYVETVISADLAPRATFPAEPGGKPGVLGASAPLAPAKTGEQSWASVGTNGHELTAIAWQDTRDGLPQVYVALSRNGGNTFGPAQRVAPSADPQRTPSVVLTPTSIYVAWQEEIGGEQRIKVARAEHRNGRFVEIGALPTEDPADEWLPRLAFASAVPGNGRGGLVCLAFVQTSGNEERVMLARTLDGDLDWRIAPVDTRDRAYPSPNIRNNQWAPSIAIRGSAVAVAWVEFRSYSWDVYLARSEDGGRTFAEPARVDDAPDARERVHGDVTLTFSSDGSLVCGWTDQRLRGAPTKVRAARIEGAPGPSSVLAGSAGAGCLSWRTQVTTLGDGRVAAVWQDFRTEGNDIWLAVSNNGGATFGPDTRIDDGGEGPSFQFSPRLAAVGPQRMLVVWEDTRNGRRQLRYVVGALRPR